MNQDQNLAQNFADISIQLANLYNNTGIYLGDQNRHKEAIEWYKKGLEVAPQEASIYYNMGVSFSKLEQYNLAIMSYKQALEIKDNYTWAHFGLAMGYLRRFYRDENELKSCRRLYKKELLALIERVKNLKSEEKIEASVAAGRFYPFFLAYQGEDDLELAKLHGLLMSDLVQSCYPKWSTDFPMPELKEGQRLRVGFVSRFFARSSIWKIPLQGFLEGLDKNRFETFGYMPHAPTDDCTDKAKELLEHFYASDTLESLADLIKTDRLHALFFVDIGLEAMTTRLSALRLCPLQVTTLGHPVTTGLPTIDYFLTSQLMEDALSASQYSEKLILLSGLGINYTYTPQPKIEVDWEQRGLRKESIKFLCCQSLCKYLPHRDKLFTEIAKRVPKAQFIFIAKPQEVALLLASRLESAFKEEGLDANSFVSFVPAMSEGEFISLCSACDIFLDSLDWSGFNTSLEALSVGLPLIGCWGKSARARHTGALLKAMKQEKWIANSFEEYIEKATTLACNPSLRQQLAAEMKQSYPSLLRDLRPIRELEEFLLKEVKRLSSH